MIIIEIWSIKMLFMYFLMVDDFFGEEGVFDYDGSYCKIIIIIFIVCYRFYR